MRAVRRARATERSWIDATHNDGRGFRHSAEVNDFLEKMAETTPAPINKPTISLSVAEQIDIRVGTIRSVDEVIGSDELMRRELVSVTMNAPSLPVSAANAKIHVNSTVDRHCLWLVLNRVGLFGMLSEGMLFDIGFSDGLRPVLAIPETLVPDGYRAA